jgi:hypothetical protein
VMCLQAGVPDHAMLDRGGEPPDVAWPDQIPVAISKVPYNN